MKLVVTSVLLSCVASGEWAFSAAHAQELICDDVRAMNREQRAQCYRERTAADAGSRAGGADQPDVSIEAGQADGRGELTFKRDRNEGALRVALSFGAPTDKQSGIADFTNLDGLAKDLTVGYALRWLPWADRFDPASTPPKGELPSRKERAATKLLRDTSDLFSQAEQKGIEVANDAGLEELVAATKPCPADVSQRVCDEVAAEARSLLRRLHRTEDAVHLDSKVSYNKYDFVGAGDAPDQSDEFGLSVKLGYSRYFAGGRWTVMSGFQRAYKESTTKAQLCTEIEGSTLQSCMILPFGAPERLEGMITHLEFRRLFGGPKEAQLVVAPLLSYDGAQDVWGVQLPLYLFRNKEGLFSGGLRFGWRSDEERFVGSVFVSKPLGAQ